ncbi:unnamed protein product [Soboliphyme baturini]|uniref:Uncharacterized protein n=1 Tax=Soboliphyme baturini TaxID=241478 RepID=A0A183IQP6_9BILA|nr:unnamed protein product [Soboliphyme baturini]
MEMSADDEAKSLQVATSHTCGANDDEGDRDGEATRRGAARTQIQTLACLSLQHDMRQERCPDRTWMSVDLVMSQNLHGLDPQSSASSDRCLTASLLDCFTVNGSELRDEDTTRRSHRDGTATQTTN